MRTLESLLEKFLGLMVFLGFMGAMMYAPDVPDEDSFMQVVATYGTCLAMVVIPAVIQRLMGWNWFSDLPPKKRWPRQTTISTGQTYMAWLLWRDKS